MLASNEGDGAPARPSVAADVSCGARQDLGDAALFLEGSIALVVERRAEKAPRRHHLRRTPILARESAAHALHLLPDALDLRDDRIRDVPAFLEEGKAGLGRAVELARGIRRNRRVADLLEIGERRIDDAGARRIKSARALLEFLDDLITVPRLL